MTQHYVLKIVIDPQSPLFQGRYRETHLGKPKIMSILKIKDIYIFAIEEVLILIVFILINNKYTLMYICSLT